MKDLELLPTGRVEQLVDRVAVVHRDQHDHRRAAEQGLVFDVVLVDLVARVQVAVLAGCEVELGDPEAEADGEEQDAQRDPAGVLAELDRQPVPQPVHRTPKLRPSDRVSVATVHA